ncbi:MAG: hypothetical protein KatS3mg062_0058 [Tepidiforma sp.]|nr:MAG: hypothetical protein KatS3mg062_0058 [Tepidiforma sp.]
MTAHRPHQPARWTVSVAGLAWCGAILFYAAVRAAALVHVPVGGLELWSLAGAWQAHTGFDDARYIPTLFQALTAGLFRVDGSELLPRLGAIAASLTVPASLFALRERIGQPAALAAVIILAIDPLQVALGPTATVSAFDVPVVFAALACSERFRASAWLAAAGGAAFATAGAGVLPLVFAAALCVRPRSLPGLPAAAASAGAAAGVLLASTGFGAGWQGVTVPPFDHFAAGFDAEWSTETTRRLLALYGWAPALAAGVWVASRLHAGGPRLPGKQLDRFLAAWWASSLAWAVVAGGAHDPVPAAALTAASAIPAARFLTALVDQLGTVSWRKAGWPLAAALLAAVTIVGPLLDWARLGRVGPGSEVAAVIVLSGVVIGALVLLLRFPVTRPAAVLPAVAVAATPWLSGGFAVASGSPNEPLPSPVTTLQASEIRDIIVGPSRDPSGIVAIHPAAADALTWPLRGASGLVVTSRIPPNAAVVIWEPGGSPPDGFRAYEGRWAILRERNGPAGGFLDYLRWLGSRNTLPVRDVSAAVYIREQP